MSEERFITPCELPTPYERELLTILVEECAEVQQRATKLLRFGRDEVQPGQPDSNAARLSQEIGDLFAMIDLAADAGLVDTIAIFDQKDRKRLKLAKFMQTLEARP